MRRLSGTLVLEGALYRGAVTFGELIEAVEVTGEGSGGPPFVLPGFIDTHVHGGGGADTMDGAEGVRRLALFHARYGVTSLLPTTITHPWPAVMRALAGVAQVHAGAPDDEVRADVLGAHLEGPFVNPGKLGAQPPFAVPPTPELVAEVLAAGIVRVVTLAPELEHAVTAARRLAAAGVRVSFGHSLATAEQVAVVSEAVRSQGGTVGFTHLYNAMTQLGSREPGMVGAAFADPEAYAELILDLHHVHPVAFRAASAAKPGHLHLITDAIRACGLSEGESELGGQRVIVKDGAARLEGGALAGSVLTLDQALRNAVLRGGLDLAAASRALSGVPARYLGLTDRGELAASLRSDLVVLDGDLRVQEVFVGGRAVA